MFIFFLILFIIYVEKNKLKSVSQSAEGLCGGQTSPLTEAARAGAKD